MLCSKILLIRHNVSRPDTVALAKNISFHHRVSMAPKPRKKAIDSRVKAVECGVGSLRASDATILNEVRLGFARVESRLEQIHNHIDGSIKLHETRDNELYRDKPW
jgi:hypothetical protein